MIAKIFFFLGIVSILGCIFLYIICYKLPKYTKSHVSMALWNMVRGIVKQIPTEVFPIKIITLAMKIL